MDRNRLKIQGRSGVAFLLVFLLCMALGALLSQTQPAQAADTKSANPQTTTYAGSDSCKQCHEDLHTEWQETRHAHAFSSPIFQRDWTKDGSKAACLECHTTGYDPDTGTYTQEGVSCESCHGPFQPGHPTTLMPVTPNEDLCATCHKNTTDEWRASAHGQNGIQCQACHNPHAQKPMAATVTELCTNCHKERGSSFTHGTHASAGLECSNCHMYTTPRMNDPIGGLVPTGHTFAVGSDACIGCHQDTVHTRDEIVKLTGQITQTTNTADIVSLEEKVSEQEQTIAGLKSASTVRLYTGLAQGAIVGLITGGAAAWVVSKRIRLVEVEENG
jgi:predicted CXXCH cytochrome family protein